MSKPCQICGNEKTYKGSSSEERDRVKKALCRLDTLTEENIQLRENCEDAVFSEEKQALNSLKARYIELLSQREKLAKRAFARRERDRANLDNQHNQEEIAAKLEARVRAAEQELICSKTIADGLTDVLRDQSQELYVRRMQGVVSIFRMMHLEAHPPPRPSSSDSPGQALALSGCSSILSMPLPNSGNFSGVPVDAVTTAVSHIAHLVDALSGILNVVLPHPLYPFEATDCLVSAQHDLRARAQVRGSCYSLAPATLMNDRTHFRDFDWATLHEISNCRSESVHHRREAAAGVAAPHSGGKVASGDRAFQYELPVVLKAKDGERRGVEYSLNPNFPTALALVQADIVALCLRAGLRAEDLWPPEAMLLNLSLLSRHCESIVHRYASSLPPPGAAVVPAIFSMDGAPAEVGRALDDLTLGSIKDRYGSAGRRRQAEYADAARGAEDAFKAEFRLEKSGLEHESEWDVVTIEGVV